MIISFLVLITVAKGRKESEQMIKQPLAAFSVMPCTTEEYMEAATFVGATLGIGYCEAVIFEGTGIQYCNTPLWSSQPRFAVLCSTGRTEPFQAGLVEISGEPCLCKGDSCKMLKDIEAEPTLSPQRAVHTLSPASPAAGCGALCVLGLVWPEQE